MADSKSQPPRQPASGRSPERSATPPPHEVRNAGTEGAEDPALETLASLLRHSVEPEPYSSEPACREAIDLIVAISGDPSGAKLPRVADEVERALPREFGQYRLLARLGEGGMGTVYKALHLAMERVVALKMLPADRMRDSSAVARFNREIKAAGRLDHPNIVTAHDAGQTDGTHYLVMEMVEGLDVSALVKRLGPLPVAEACEIVRQAALGLEHAHQNEMVHRDIKPSNLMLTPDGGVKILDLGLALLQEHGTQPGRELTDAGQMMGTFDYMAPEQGGDSHEVDSRADIYSLGATLYKLLCGHAPLAGEDYKTAYQRLMALANREPEPIGRRRANLPEGLAEVVHRMLAHRPALRIGTAAEVAVALEPFCDGGNLPELLSRAELVDIDDGASSHSRFDTLPAALAADTTPTEIESDQSVAFLEGTVQLSDQHDAMPGAATLRPKRKRRRVAWLVVALAVLLSAAAAAVIAISNRDGVLIVETVDPNVELAIKQGDRVVRIANADSGWKLKLGPGRYDVELRDDADRLSLSARRITVHRGRETVLEVERRAAPRDEPATAPRAAAHVDRGWVRFVNRHSKRCMSVHKASLKEGESLRQHASVPGAAEQQWRIESTGQPGWYRLRNRRSGLHVTPGTLKLGEGFIQRSLKEDSDEFLFSIQESSAGHVKIVGKATGLCMSIWGGETREDQWIIQWAFAKAATDHHWQIEPVDPKEAFADATDLIPLIDPDKHAVEGTWRKDGNDLVVEKPKGGARVFAPLPVEGSYRLRVEFTRTAGDHDINFNLPIGQRQCRLLLSGWWGGHNGLHLLDGKEAKDNPTRFPYQFTNGRRYRVDVTVEISGETVTVLAEIEGEPMLRFSGKADRLSIDKRWAIPQPGHIGLGTACDMRFHSAKLVMISGKNDSPEGLSPVAILPVAGPSGIQNLSAGMPSSWLKPGAFARIRGQGEIEFPALPISSYVLETKMTFHNPRGQVLLRTGVPGAVTELSLGPRWAQDKDVTTVPCRLFNVQYSWFHWKGERQLPTDRMVALKLIVCDYEKWLFLDGERILGANGTPADFHLTISADDEVEATIHECSCRALGVEDVELVGRQMPVLRIKTDLRETTARLKSQSEKNLGSQPQEGKSFRVATTGSVMRWIDPGEFRMGSPDAGQDLWGRGSERVRISRGYWIGQYELTQGEWVKIRPDNPSRVTGSPYLPVNWLSWEDAQAFCNKLTDRERAAGRLAEGYEYRLPTEAEWEFACRAGGDEPFPVPKDKFNWRGNKSRTLLEVGSTPPNALGLYDMLGNAPEWCLDAWHAYPKKQEQATVDRYHAGDPAKSRFAIRGGGFWSREPGSVTSHARDQGDNRPVGYRGFRLALAGILDSDRDSHVTDASKTVNGKPTAEAPREAEEKLKQSDVGKQPVPAKPFPELADGVEWIELLSLVRIKEDVIFGEWRKRGNELVCQPANTARLVLPVRALGDFDLEMEFTVASLKDGMFFRFPVGKSACRHWLMHSKTYSGLELLDGRPAQRNKTTRAVSLKSGHRYKWHAAVRLRDEVASVRMKLDGKELVNWSGDRSRFEGRRNMGPEPARHPQWVEGAGLLAIAAIEDEVVYHTVRFRAAEGQYRLSRPVEITNLIGMKARLVPPGALQDGGNEVKKENAR